MIWNNDSYLIDGKVFHSSSSPVRGMDGTYYGRVWEFFDVTERVQREQNLQEAYTIIEAQYEKLAVNEETLRNQYFALKEAENDLDMTNSFLSALMAASDHGTVFIDSGMRIRYFNQVFCETWGLTEDVIYLGADGYNLISYCMKQTNNPHEFISDSITQLSDFGDTVWKDQLYLSDGRVLKRVSSPVRGLDGTYYGRIWEETDITENVQREFQTP